MGRKPAPALENERKSAIQSESLRSDRPLRVSRLLRQSKGRTALTQHQLQELLESEQARPFIEQGEERGTSSPSSWRAFAVEHDLGEEDVEASTRELEAIGLEIREAAAEEAAQAKEWKPKQPDPDAVVGSADSLQLFLADVGRHKLLTAAEEIALREAHRARRPDCEASHDRVEPPARRLDREGLRGLASRSVTSSLEGTLGLNRAVEKFVGGGAGSLDLRDVVDPPVGPACRREPRADDGVGPTSSSGQKLSRRRAASRSSLAARRRRRSAGGDGARRCSTATVALGAAARLGLAEPDGRRGRRG